MLTRGIISYDIVSLNLVEQQEHLRETVYI